MRKIKFRGKSVSENEWVYGSLCYDSDGVFISRFGCYAWKEVYSETVGQFTGLLDKNGVEIYEGDILGVGDKVIGYVVGDVRGYCYDVKYAAPLKNGETAWSLYATVTGDYPNQIEAIGTIFDNPELLTNKKE